MAVDEGKEKKYREQGPGGGASPEFRPAKLTSPVAINQSIHASSSLVSSYPRPYKQNRKKENERKEKESQAPYTKIHPSTQNHSRHQAKPNPPFASKRVSSCPLPPHDQSQLEWMNGWGFFVTCLSISFSLLFVFLSMGSGLEGKDSIYAVRHGSLHQTSSLALAPVCGHAYQNIFRNWYFFFVRVSVDLFLYAFSLVSFRFDEMASHYFLACIRYRVPHARRSASRFQRYWDL